MDKSIVMVAYSEMTRKCKLCKKTIKDNNSIIYCESGQCFWHKKCLKNKLNVEFDRRMDPSYDRAGCTNYKTRICQCGHLLRKKDSLKRTMKKMAKWATIPIFLILIVI